MQSKRSFAERRAEADRDAWLAIDAILRVCPRPPGSKSARPCNLAELAAVAETRGIEFAWSDFLHEFFQWKDITLFAVPPPESLGAGWCALIAGAAEYLLRRYDFPVPPWTEEPRFFLPERWDLAAMTAPFVFWGMEERAANTPEAFLRRNVVFEARNLITL